MGSGAGCGNELPRASRFRRSHNAQPDGRPAPRRTAVAPAKFDVVTGVVSELGEERPLRAAVALPERVQRVDVGEELRDPADEPLPVQPPQPISGCQPAENIAGVGGEVLGQTKQRPLGDRDRPQLTGPVVNVAED